jgi:hypothetical protein
MGVISTGWILLCVEIDGGADLEIGASYRCGKIDDDARIDA